MSNNYASYYVRPSAVQYNNYVMSQTIGPLSTSQTPSLLGYHSYGVLTGVHPNPPKFYPADNGSLFSQSRFQYSQCDTSAKQQMIAREKTIAQSRSYKFISSSSQRQIPINSNHMNYINPVPSSMRTSVLKRQAIGKSSFKQGLPTNALLSYKNYNTNDVKSALQFSRSGGCVAPAKKGSIYNHSCTAGGGICNTGSIVGQGY